MFTFCSTVTVSSDLSAPRAAQEKTRTRWKKSEAALRPGNSIFNRKSNPGGSGPVFLRSVTGRPLATGPSSPVACCRCSRLFCILCCVPCPHTSVVCVPLITTNCWCHHATCQAPATGAARRGGAHTPFSSTCSLLHQHRDVLVSMTRLRLSVSFFSSNFLHVFLLNNV